MVQIITLNVKGLRSPNKRMMVLRHLKRLKADIALLKEAHLEEKDFSRLQHLWVGGVYTVPQHKHIKRVFARFCTKM